MKLSLVLISDEKGNHDGLCRFLQWSMHRVVIETPAFVVFVSLIVMLKLSSGYACKYL